MTVLMMEITNQNSVASNHVCPHQELRGPGSVTIMNPCRPKRVKP